MDRRHFCQSSLALLGAGMSGFLPQLAQAARRSQSEPRRHCILLWMTGGPSQLDTFDMKPGHANGGEFKEIATSVPGLRFSEHLPALSRHADQLAIVRSLSTKEGDHGRGTYLMRTGQQPAGQLRYPTIGASLSKELGDPADEMPNFVAISPYRVFNQDAYGPGFLGPRFAPMTVGATDNLQMEVADNEGYAQLQVDDLNPPPGVDAAKFERRLQLWDSLQSRFKQRYASSVAAAHDTVYRKAIRFMQSEKANAFDLSQEPEKLRDAYGRGRFGQGCLLARRLIEEGVSFVEVSLGFAGGNSLGWDTHQNNFPAVKSLCQELDQGWAMLLQDLKDRDLLERTTILWMGEFGRTPRINEQGGRDHFPNAWSCVFAGGGIQGGQAYGKTSEDGTTVEENKVDVGQVLATLCTAVGVAPEHENISQLGRPVKISEGEAIAELLRS